jgi:hypothetical protein
LIGLRLLGAGSSTKKIKVKRMKKVKRGLASEQSGHCSLGKCLKEITRHVDLRQTSHGNASEYLQH